MVLLEVTSVTKHLFDVENYFEITSVSSGENVAMPQNAKHDQGHRAKKVKTGYQFQCLCKQEKCDPNLVDLLKSYTGMPLK